MPDSPLPVATISSESPLTPAVNAWKMFLEDQDRSIHTIKAFAADVNLLAGYLPPDRPIGSITTKELNAFLEWMKSGRGVPCSPKTLSRRITSLKSFFRWLHGNGVILIDPAEDVVQKSVLSPLPEILTPEELELVRSSAQKYRTLESADARPQALLDLLVATGIKKGECLGINLKHIDLDAPGGPLLFVRYANPKYRYKERKIALKKEWAKVYKEYIAQYNPRDQLFPWSPRRLEYILEDIGKDAGISKHLSFLMCRWTCAVGDFEAGMDHTKIRQKLGVSEIQWREIKLKLKRLSVSTAGEK
ncbi:MAG: tyrosine-type recombinase/integrase [Anaerolineae bacterium]|nr:tyrosine-type recombinase/integrase [Anaerolineae bacterium]